MNKSKGTQKDMDMDTKLCPKHGVPLVIYKPGGIYEKEIRDEDGNLIGIEEIEIELEECSECKMEDEEKREQEKIDDLIDQLYLHPSQNLEISEKIEEKLSDPDKQKMLTTSSSIIDIYAPMLGELAQCQLEVGEALIKFLISCQLFHLDMEDSMGMMLPNLAYLWIAPTSVGKDPAINNGIRDFQDVIVEENFFRLYNEVTGPEFVRSVGQLMGKRKETQERIRTLNIWNEFSTFAKLSGTKGTNTGIETLNQAIDGYVQGRATVNRKEDVGSNVYSMVFAAGTPTFLKYIGDDFFDLGGASRFDILPFKPGPITDIAPTRNAMDNFKKDLKIELRNIRDRVKKVRWDPEMWETYLIYRKQILTEVRECQMTMQDSLAEENYAIISRGKFPVKVLKHAVVHAAARHNYTESGFLYVEPEDLDRAIADVEKHHTYLMELYTAYKEMDWRNASDSSARKVLRLIGTISKRYRVSKEVVKSKTTDPKTGGERETKSIHHIVEQSEDGEYVAHSSLLSMSHLKAKGYGSFEEAITTLLERRAIEKLEAGDSVLVYFREPGKEDKPTASVLYKLK